MLAHVLSFFGGGFIPPLIILLAKRDSRFVKFHALQALLINVVLFGVVFGGFFITMFVTMAKAMEQGPVVPGAHAAPSPPPPALFVFFPLMFLGMGGWVISSIVLGIRANAGHWSSLPGFGGITRKLIGPPED
jgi:uncharacterized membrane protein